MTTKNDNTPREPGFYGEQANVYEPKSQRLKRFYTPQPVEVTRADYDAWANDYDQNTVLDTGYCAPETIADMIASHAASKDQPIVDLGCGTGLLGRHLMDRGFCNIEGWDLSPGMLAKAKATRAYARLAEIDLTSSLPFAPRSQTLMASVGVYGPGVVGPEHLSLLVEPLALGGLSIHTVNGLSWRKRPFEEALTKLVEAGHFSIVEQRWAPYIAGENIDGVYLVLRRAS